MRGHKIQYSDKELAFVKANSTLARSETFRLFQKMFDRPDVSKNNIKALCKRKRWFTGRDGQFQKGHDTYKGGPGGPNVTSFKAGNKPANLKPLYSERLSVDGYVEIKVPEVNPYTGAPTRYRYKHRWVWEKHNPPIEKGSILRFIDGDRLNCSVDNLECISMGLNAILNKKQYSTLPEELQPVTRTLAELQHKQGQLKSQNLPG